MIEYFSNTPSYVFNNPKYLHYVVEYAGNIDEDASKSTTSYITVINDKYAIISIPYTDKLKDRLTLENSPFPSIIYISKYYIYTLQDLSPLDASKINYLQISPPLYLTGKNVLVGMIDSGINYLNKEFMNDDGTTRIINIWDQNIPPSDKSQTILFGSLYSNDDINKAITAYNEGKDPYAIVPSKDEIGHGTAMAGIIGAKGLNPNTKGAAPDCEFVIIKLIEDFAVKNAFNTNVPIYDRSSIIIALDFLYKYALSTNKPMVIYLPLGTTFGNHKGDGLLEDYINEISSNKGVVVVTGTGNEGGSAGHTSGKVPPKNSFEDISFNVSPDQKFLRIEIWIDKPNTISIDVISSTGSNTGIISPMLNQSNITEFAFENTTVLVNYYLPDELTGDELIVIDFSNLSPGIWKIRLHSVYVLNGYYNAWMLQKGLIVGNTRFLSPDPYGTFTGPGSASNIITVANYDQNNFGIVESSGLDFLNAKEVRIDIAAGGINALTTAGIDSTTVVSGTSVSAAITAAACSLLFQWGIVDGHDPDMYSQKLKNYLSKGTLKRRNDSYPNAEWGYGALNIIGVFDYLK